MEQYGAIRTRYSLSDNNNGGKQKKASITNYTWLLMADDRNRKEDVPILTHPHYWQRLFIHYFILTHPQKWAVSINPYPHAKT